MAKFVDGQGQEAVVGRQGYWLDSGDFVSTADLDAEDIGQIGFPRDWPNVYGTSKALKQLVGKKGKCAGKKVGVVPLPDANQLSLVTGQQFYPLQSFSNAEKAAKAAGIDIVRGWAVYEHLEKDISEAFVAERFWWNSLADGTWVDFTPRPEAIQEMLLAEAVDGAPKEQQALSSQQQKLLQRLMSQRFPGSAPPEKVPAVPAPEPAPAPASRPTAAPAPKITTKIQQKAKTPISPSAAPQSLRELARRVQQGELEAVRQLDEKLRGDDELCVQIASEGLATPLSKMLGDSKHQEWGPDGTQGHTL
eukprot:Skav215586  [mRNA]  locus=scaffold666:84557:85474:+ [translate_table: standard]